MQTLLIIAALLCGVVGIVGSVVPILPGATLSFVGLVCAYFVEGTAITTTQLWLWGIITLAISIADYILPAYFSRLYGGSKAGITGAIIGVFVGLFFGPLGIILGPFVGAVAGEMLREQRPLQEAVKVGFGSLVSFVVGTGLKLAATIAMMFYISRDIISMVF